MTTWSTEVYKPRRHTARATFRFFLKKKNVFKSRVTSSVFLTDEDLRVRRNDFPKYTLYILGSRLGRSVTKNDTFYIHMFLFYHKFDCTIWKLDRVCLS